MPSYHPEHPLGLLRDQKSQHILKPWQFPPRGDCEVHTYERIWSDDGVGDKALRSLRPLVPGYFGKRAVIVDGVCKFCENQ